MVTLDKKRIQKEAQCWQQSDDAHTKTKLHTKYTQTERS